MSVVLVLSHRGQSFLSEWADSLKELGCRAYVLSSKPKLDPAKWTASLDPVFIGAEVGETDTLTDRDVDQFIIKLRSLNIKPVAAVTVWEGYRHISARVNKQLGARDANPSQVLQLRDKLQVRNTLLRDGLTCKTVRILNQEIFEEAKRLGGSYFIKPRSGIASFGAFRLTPKVEWGDIEKLKLQMGLDHDYRDHFRNNDSLILEDFIEGKEFSFEILAENGALTVFAAHEKVELEEKGKTTLETACVSPPISLNSQREIKECLDWLDKVASALRIREGVYHFEARCENGRWELIEINPRVGGAFILHSTRAVSGHSLLTEWLSVLLAKPSRSPIRIRSWGRQYQRHLDFRSFFRVYFAEPGMQIQSIEINNNSFNPVLSKCFYKRGDQTPDAAREIFLGQAMWRIAPGSKDLETALQDSRNHLEVRYA